MNTADADRPTQPPAPPMPLRWVAVLGLLAAVAPLSIDMYLPAFPAMAAEFRTTAPAIQLTLTTFMVGLGLGQFIIGPLSDRSGRRPLMVGGTIICVLASAACALAPTIELLAAFRFLQGFGGAAGVVLSRAVVSDRARGPAAARIFSVMMMIHGLAPIAAPVVGGIVTEHVSWRAVFWILSGLAAAMFAGVAVVLTETHPPGNRATGGLATTLRTARSALANRRYIGYTLAFAFGFAVMAAYISASPFILQNILGLSKIQNSLAFAANAVGLIITNAVNARIVARVGRHRLLTLGILLLLVFAGLLLVDAIVGPTLWPTLLLMGGTVSSIGLVAANGTSLALEEAHSAAGSASAVLGALQFGLGAVFAPLVGIAGDHTAVPMAVVMFASALIGAAALLLLTPRTTE